MFRQIRLFGRPSSAVTHGILFICFLAAYALLRSHTFWGELVHDDGLFLLGAQTWAKGYIPYKDFWDHKPPCVFLYNAIPLFLFPFSQFAVKFFHCIVLSCSAVFLFYFCKKHTSTIASIITCAFYIYFTSQRYTIQSGGLTEEGALLFVILAYWMLSETKSNRWWFYILAGFSLGTAVQFRQTFAVEAAFAAGLIWLNQPNFKSTLTYIAYLAAGMILPELLFGLYFLINSAWWDFFEASYLYNFYYIGPGRPEIDWATILQRQKEIITQTGIFLLSPFIALCCLQWMKPLHRKLSLLLWITFTGDCIAISLSGEFYAHYYVQASITCAIFMTLSIHTFFTVWQDKPSLQTIAGRTFTVLITLFTIYLSYYSGLQCYRSFNQTLEATQQPNSTYTFQHNVADAIQSVTNPEDKILLIGRTPNSVYFLSKRLAGSRFYHYSPIWKPSMKGAVTQKQKEEFLNDITTNQPTLLLFDLTRLRGNHGINRVEQDLPEALPYIKENYSELSEHVSNIYEKWVWYDIRLHIMIRNDKMDKVFKRIRDVDN